MLEWQKKEAETIQSYPEKNNNSIASIKYEYSQSRTGSLKCSFPDLEKPYKIDAHSFNRIPNQNGRSARLLMIAQNRDSDFNGQKVIKTEICDESNAAYSAEEADSAQFTSLRSADPNNKSPQTKPAPASNVFKSNLLAIKIENSHMNRTSSNGPRGIADLSTKPFGPGSGHPIFDKALCNNDKVFAMRNISPSGGMTPVSTNRFFEEKSRARAATKLIKPTKRRNTGNKLTIQCVKLKK